MVDMIAASIFCIEWEEALKAQARKKHERERKRAWRAANPQKDRETAQRYRAAHRDEINAKMRDWIKKNPQKKRAASRRDYQKNRRARRAKADEWKRAHPGYVPPSIRRKKDEQERLQYSFPFTIETTFDLVAEFLLY
jgi:hypothetical protein